MTANVTSTARKHSSSWWYLPFLMVALILGFATVAGATMAAPSGAGASVPANGANEAPKGPAQPNNCGVGGGYNYQIVTGTATIIPGATDVGNHCDDCTTAGIPLPFPVVFYKRLFTTANVSSNGNLQFTSNNASLSNACLPQATFTDPIFPHWDDMRTDQVGTGCTAYGGIGCGVFTAVLGTSPNRQFVIEWRTVYFGASTTRANFEVILYESIDRIDMIYGEVAQGGSSATVGVQRDTGASLQYTQFECNTASTLFTGLMLSYTPGPCFTPTVTPGGLTLTPTNTPIPTNTPTITLTRTITPTPTPLVATKTPAPCGPGSNYIITQIQPSTPISGTLDTGNHCDDCTTAINLPFPANLYGQGPFPTANVDSNGTLQFVSNISVFTNSCLPSASHSFTIFPHWDDLYTISTANCPGCGIFTAVVGTSPNRIFVIEWRNQFFPGTSGTVNFEVLLYENQDYFDVLYGQVDNGGTGATIGVQKTIGGQFTQFECNTGGITYGLQHRYAAFPCGAQTFTPTNTPPPTITPTPTVSNTIPPTRTPQCKDYQAATSTATMIPGVTDTGNHGDDTVTVITLPFPVIFYNVNRTTVNASSNGNLQFNSANITFANSCLPVTTMNDLLAPYWDDLNTTATLSGCTAYTSGCGIFTTVVGTAPCRTFVIEWRAVDFANNALVENFEVLLYECINKYDTIYGRVDTLGNGATVGVQNGTGPQYTQFECNTGGISNGLRINWLPITACVTNTPVPTITRTPSSTPTHIPGTIIVQKLNADTNQPLPGWTMILHQGSGCSGPTLQTQVTDANGDATFTGLAAGTYSVEEVLQSGWTPVGSGVCQDVVVSLRNGVVLTSPSSNSNVAAPAQGKQQPNALPKSQAGKPQIIGPAGKPAANANRPASPNVVLYDQYNNPGANSIVSQNFEPANDAFDSQLADDFVVPAGPSWTINLVEVQGVYFNGPGPAASVNVRFYADAAGLPGGAPVASCLACPYTDTSGGLGSYSISLSPAVTLPPGTYWVEVQVNMNFTPGGEWGWTDRTVQGGLNTAAWQNPGNGFATGCTAWNRKLICIPTATGPDQVFRLSGTVGGYPGAGNDSFNSSANASVVITGTGQDAFRLDGPATIHRSDPCVGCGPGGRTYIDTEMLAMDLQGNSSVFGPVHIRESPTRQSLGRTQQQSPGVDFPADSFFDVFVEIDTSAGVLHNNDPVHVTSVINAIPPYGSPYISQGPITLFNAANQPVGRLDVIKHIPLGPNSTLVIFRNRFCKPSLVGHVTLQGIPQPNSRNTLKPLTLVLKQPAGTAYTIPVTLDANGVYTVNLSTIPSGTYNWRLRGIKYLANCGSVTLNPCPPSITNLEHGTLRAGDVVVTPANQENIVNAVDFNNLKGLFGQACTCPADLDNSGVVNAQDFNLLKGNFGQAGCPVLP